jgi:hypothetical protein
MSMSPFGVDHGDISKSAKEAFKQAWRVGSEKRASRKLVMGAFHNARSNGDPLGVASNKALTATLPVRRSWRKKYSELGRGQKLVAQTSAHSRTLAVGAAGGGGYVGLKEYKKSPGKYELQNYKRKGSTVEA